jgi:hypothetical protein
VAEPGIIAQEKKMLSSIGSTAYQNAASLLTSDNSLISQAAPTTAVTSQSSTPSSAPAANTGDRVTLSPEVDAARLRESLGLNPTGKLKRQDFEAQIQSDQKGVQQSLQAQIDALAPGTSGTIGKLTLSLDAKGQIQVTGDWSGDDALAKNLNADPDFKQMFTRLATNSGLVNYTDQLVSGGANAATLNDYLNADSSDTADNNLNTLIQQYTSLKTSKNSLASLINLSSNSGPPFSLTYQNGATSSSQ